MPDEENNRLRTLWPEFEPFDSGFLPEADGHRVFYMRSGNPEGEPLIILHGGPGSGSNPDHRRLFDPARFHIVQFDQRGCGQSTPLGRLEANTTPHLVADMVRLLDSLDIKRLHVMGGSWGSTLALAFADTHPERVASLIVYGIFLCRRSELQALYFPGGIASQVYPDLFAPFIELLPEDERADPIEAYSRIFLGSDVARRLEALATWTRLEMKMLRLIVPDAELETVMDNPDFVLSHSLFENHYFRSQGFIDGNGLLREIGGRLQGKPVHIIAGRYDMVCPMVTAYELHKAVPGSGLTIVPAAGHSFREPGVTDALIKAGEALPVIGT